MPMRSCNWRKLIIKFRYFYYNVMKKTNIIALAVSVCVVLSSFGMVYAADESDLTIQINPGTLEANILDENRVAVATPSASLSAKNFSFTCLTGLDASTGVLGTNTQRIYVTNPDAADSGWTLTMAATAGPTALWQNAGLTQNFDYNDTSSSGCADGADASDTKAGLLAIDPSVGTFTADCVTCTTASITLGSSAQFNQGTVDSITLLNAAALSNDIFRGYLTGVGVNQTIPAEQPVDSYAINMTLTATAL